MNLKIVFLIHLAAQIFAEATNSKSSQIFHEHIFIKEARNT